MVRVGLTCSLDYWLIYDALTLGYFAPVNANGDFIEDTQDAWKQHVDPQFVQGAHWRQILHNNLPLDMSYVIRVEHLPHRPFNHHVILELAFRQWMRAAFPHEEVNPALKSPSALFYQGFLRGYVEYVRWKMWAQRKHPTLRPWFDPEKRHRQPQSFINAIHNSDDWDTMWRLFDPPDAADYLWKILMQQGGIVDFDLDQCYIDVDANRMVGLKRGAYDVILNLLDDHRMSSATTSRASLKLGAYDMTAYQSNQHLPWLVEPVLRYLVWWMRETRKLLLMSGAHTNFGARPHWLVQRNDISADWLDALFKRHLTAFEPAAHDDLVILDSTTARFVSYYRALLNSVQRGYNKPIVQMISTLPEIQMNQLLHWQIEGVKA